MDSVPKEYPRPPRMSGLSFRDCLVRDVELFFDHLTVRVLFQTFLFVGTLRDRMDVCMP